MEIFSRLDQSGLDHLNIKHFSSLNIEQSVLVPDLADYSVGKFKSEASRFKMINVVNCCLSGIIQTKEPLNLTTEHSPKTQL